MPQDVPGKRLPESVWGEPESCVKNDRKGAGTERMASFEDWVLSPNLVFCGGCSTVRTTSEANGGNRSWQTHYEVARRIEVGRLSLGEA